MGSFSLVKKSPYLKGFITVIWPILSIIGRSKSLASFPVSPSEFSGSTPAVFYDRVNSELVTWL